MPQRDPILGDGDGPDRPGLSRARSPADVHLGLGLGPKISDAVRRPCNGRLRVGNWTGLFEEVLFVLLASNLVNLPLEIGVEGRRRIRALGNEEIGAGRCCGAHRSARRRRCRSGAAAQFGDRAPAWPGWDCNRNSFTTMGAAVSGPGLVPTVPAGCGVFNAAGSAAPPAVCGAAGSATTGCVGAVSATRAGFEIESRPAGGLPSRLEVMRATPQRQEARGLTWSSGRRHQARLGGGGRSSGTTAPAWGAASPAGRTGSVAGALAFASSRFGSDWRAVCCGSGGSLRVLSPAVDRIGEPSAAVGSSVRCCHRQWCRSCRGQGSWDLTRLSRCGRTVLGGPRRWILGLVGFASKRR